MPRKQKPKRLTLGKAYRLKPGSKRIGLVLPVRGRLRFVCWVHGELKLYPATQVQAVAMEPSLGELCQLWGTTVEEVDKFSDRLLYEQHPDVVKVRGDPGRRA